MNIKTFVLLYQKLKNHGSLLWLVSTGWYLFKVESLRWANKWSLHAPVVSLCLHTVNGPPSWLIHLEVNIPIRLDRGADCMLFMSVVWVFPKGWQWGDWGPVQSDQVLEALFSKGLNASLPESGLLRPSSEDKSGVAHVCNWNPEVQGYTDLQASLS